MVSILQAHCQVILILLFNLLLYNFTIKYRSSDGQNGLSGRKTGVTDSKEEKTGIAGKD
jgi:hypothetical protein